MVKAAPTKSYLYAGRIGDDSLQCLFKGTGAHFANTNEPMQMLGARGGGGEEQEASFENLSL